MNIFLRELKANRKALIIWSVCMVLFVLSGMSKYTAYSAGGASADLFAKMPFSLKALLGIGSFDVSTMPGFFAFSISISRTYNRHSCSVVRKQHYRERGA